MDSTTEHEELIARYLNGDFSEEDEERLFSWVEKSYENKIYFLEIKDTWDASRKKSLEETEELLTFYKKQATGKTTLSFPSWVYGLSAAAILIGGLLIGGLLFPTNQPISNRQVESFFVPQGSSSELTLIDGTKIKLNADSKLVIDPDFSRTNRKVTLVGEGYFEVESDKTHPFTVHTTKFDVLVTGTKFNISSYVEDQRISATLAEGKIKLKTCNRQVITVEPGEKISFDQETMIERKEQIDIETELAWVRGDFVFREIPFPDLIKRLERWYDVKLDYRSQELESMFYSGSFKNQETIWQVLDALKLTSPINYEKINFRRFKLTYQPMK